MLFSIAFVASPPWPWVLLHSTSIDVLEWEKPCQNHPLQEAGQIQNPTASTDDCPVVVLVLACWGGSIISLGSKSSNVHYCTDATHCNISSIGFLCAIDVSNLKTSIGPQPLRLLTHVTCSNVISASFHSSSLGHWFFRTACPARLNHWLGISTDEPCPWTWMVPHHRQITCYCWQQGALTLRAWSRQNGRLLWMMYFTVLHSSYIFFANVCSEVGSRARWYAQGLVAPKWEEVRSEACRFHVKPKQQPSSWNASRIRRRMTLCRSLKHELASWTMLA